MNDWPKSIAERRALFFPIWAEALRSGKYKQGHGALRSDGDKFCCLGVACDLGSKNDWHQGHPTGLMTYGGELGAPDSKTQWLMGFYPGEAGALAEANDGGFTFEGIADYLDQAATLNPHESKMRRDTFGM